MHKKREDCVCVCVCVCVLGWGGGSVSSTDKVSDS